MSILEHTLMLLSIESKAENICLKFLINNIGWFQQQSSILPSNVLQMRITSLQSKISLLGKGGIEELLKEHGLLFTPAGSRKHRTLRHFLMPTQTEPGISLESGQKRQIFLSQKEISTALHWTLPLLIEAWMFLQEILLST